MEPLFLQHSLCCPLPSQQSTQSSQEEFFHFYIFIYHIVSHTVRQPLINHGTARSHPIAQEYIEQHKCIFCLQLCFFFIHPRETANIFVREISNREIFSIIEDDYLSLIVSWIVG